MRAHNFLDLTGRIFERLTVIQFDSVKHNKAYWLCLCTCGETKVICSTNLMRGLVKSCTCLRKERIATKKLYAVWKLIIKRCFDLEDKDYGGRGITVCEEWQGSPTGVSNFNNWALANGYIKGLQIDRINNNGPYSPENCKWVTRSANMRNTRRTKRVVYKGEEWALPDLAEYLGIVPMSVVQHRIHKGWDYIKAVTTPRLR